MIEHEFERKGFGTGDDDEITVEELCGRYQTDVRSGLKKEVAEALLKKQGKNLICPKRKGLHLAAIAFSSCSGAGLFLWLVAALCLASTSARIALGDLRDRITLLSCVVLFLSALSVGLIICLQDRRSRDLHAYDRFADKETEVIRDGKQMKIPTEDLVVGDLVSLKCGDRVPADVRIVESENLKMDNFALTGVSDPQILHRNIKEANILDGTNVALHSCTVVEGTARGIVIRKGRQTLLATIFALRDKNGRLSGPIARQVIRFLNLSSCWVALFAVIFTLIFWFSAENRKITSAVDLFVLTVLGCLTENFLFATLLSLWLYSRMMSWRCCTMKSIGVMERLPFVSTICLNKPGVVTQNRSVVTNLWFDKKDVEVWGGTKIIWKEKASATFRELAKCAILSSEAEFEQEEENLPILKRKITGNPEDAAIFKFFCYTMGNRVNKFRETYPRVFWIQYGVNRKFHLSVHKMEKNYLVILMGEPEILLEKCSTYSMAGTSVPIDSAFLKSIDKACVEFAKLGETIKCLADQTVVLDKGKERRDFMHSKLPATGYRFLGIITLFDPPNSNIVQAVEQCREAGIKVFLTANDHPIAARSFARQIGVISEDSVTIEEAAEGVGQNEAQFKAVVIDGRESKTFSIRGIEALMETFPEVVFARVSPLQKLMIIASCQKNDATVAFVGDGINDTLAMTKANLGITFRADASSAADVVIADGGFKALVTCLEEGRTIYENLKKSSAFILATNTTNLIPIAVHCLFGMPLPLSPIGMVMIKYVTDLFLAVALIFERKESNVMQQPPHSATGTTFWSRQMIFLSCFQTGVVESFAGFYTYFVIMEEHGWTFPDLIGVRDRWESAVVNDLEDSWGQKWSYEGRKNLQSLCQIGYFFTHAIMQCANVFICRSQRTSLFRTSIKNWMIHFGILLEISVVISVIYFPYLNDLEQAKAPKSRWWLLPVPYIALLLAQDEARKYLIRKHPDGWLDRETTY